MAITDAFTNQAKQDFLNGVHQSGDTYKIALYSSSATLDKTTTAYTATNEVTGTNWAAGGVTLSGFSVSITSDTAHLSFTDPSVASVTISGVQGYMIYNSSKSDKALCVANFTNAPIAATAGTLLIDLPAAGASALLRIA